jgi:enoyl-CoA hydratase/carnithine racemase
MAIFCFRQYRVLSTTNIGSSNRGLKLLSPTAENSRGIPLQKLFNTKKSIRITDDGPVRTIWINRPARKNSIPVKAWSEIAEAAAEANVLEECLIIVVRGAEGYFGAGADITEFSALLTSEQGTCDYFEQMEAGMFALEATTKPVIAAIEGACFGASVALALACDVRVAARDSQFAITPAKLGISYPFGDVRRVLRAVGAGRTKSLLFSGRRIDAKEAFAIGLVDQIASDDNFDGLLADVTAVLAANSQHSIRATKAAVSSIVAGLDAERAGYPALMAAATSGTDFREGMKAFVEKRQPIFSHR